MLFNLLLANIANWLSFFFLFLVVFNSFFFTIPVEIENARLKLALATPTGAPITVANDAIDMLPVVKIKQWLIKIVKRSNIFTKLFAH